MYAAKVNPSQLPLSRWHAVQRHVLLRDGMLLLLQRRLLLRLLRAGRLRLLQRHVLLRTAACWTAAAAAAAAAALTVAAAAAAAASTSGHPTHWLIPSTLHATLPQFHETLVAVKVLLDLEEAQKTAGPDAVWTLSNPILFNLQKARAAVLNALWCGCATDRPACCAEALLWRFSH